MRKLSAWQALFILILTLDTISTIYLVEAHLAIEANPVLAWSFKIGPVLFAFVKWASFALPILAVDRLLAHPKCSGLISRHIWCLASIAYAGEYLIGSCILHR